MLVVQRSSATTIMLHATLALAVLAGIILLAAIVY